MFIGTPWIPKELLLSVKEGRLPELLLRWILAISLSVKIIFFFRRTQIRIMSATATHKKVKIENIMIIQVVIDEVSIDVPI